MIIHQIWYDLGNGKDIPDIYKSYQDSWIKHHPNWKYILWNKDSGDTFMKQNYNEYYNLYENVKYPIMKIDILRYCLLEHYGGLYADIDYKCLHSFGNYLNDDTHQIFVNESPHGMISKYIFGTSVSNSLLISKIPNHIFLKRVIKEMFKRLESYLDFYHIYYVCKTTGPLLINDILYRFSDNTIQILPFEQFNFCNSCNKCSPSKTKDLYSVHDYKSYWNDKSWLQFRKIFTCFDISHSVIIFYYFLIMFLIYQLTL